MIRAAALFVQACGLAVLLHAGRAYLAGRDPSRARLGATIAIAGACGTVVTGLDAVSALALASGVVAGLGALSRKPVPAAWFAVGGFVVAAALWASRGFGSPGDC